MQHCQRHSMSFNVSMSFIVITHSGKIVLLAAATITVTVAASATIALSLDELLLIDAKEEQQGLQQHSAHGVQIPKITRNLSTSRHSHGKFALQPDTGDILPETSTG